MKKSKCKEFLFLILFLTFNIINVYSQSNYNLVDGQGTENCLATQELIQTKPKEVLFGVHIYTNGDIYFSISDKVWFEKIFKNETFGVTVDVISKGRYDCNKKTINENNILKGIVLKPVYKKEIIENIVPNSDGLIFSKIGKIPLSLIGTEIEGNLLILSGVSICYYSNFVNIERSVWQLLPMGFYTDSLINNLEDTLGLSNNFTFSKKINIQVPFNKRSSILNNLSLKKTFDSLCLANYHIKKVEIRAYSSVEGKEIFNKSLMNERAIRISKTLEQYTLNLKKVNIIAAENWLDFYKDINQTKFAYLNKKSKAEIKQILTDTFLLSEMEPILSEHRKAIAILYVEEKTKLNLNNELLILKQFNNAVINKEVTKAQLILKEISNRIQDNQLPVGMMLKIEVPAEKEYLPILNDREIYKFTLKSTDEYEAYENLLKIKELDSTNGKLNYNICVLKFFLWQFANDTVSKNSLLSEINLLQKQNIPNTLIKRLLVNYYILKTEDQMQALNYSGKDSSLNEIKAIYNQIETTDDETYSIAKYYLQYSQREWAKAVVEPRIGSIDVSENLLFYYLNILFFEPSIYESEIFDKALLNAINLNIVRFCNFFNSIEKGGASMQLLENSKIKKIYCSECFK